MDLKIATNNKVQTISDVKIPERFRRRVRTGIELLDDWASGGFIPGSTVTLSAQAGAGKTTLLLQLCEAITLQGHRAVYLTGEEDIRQLALSCERIGVRNIAAGNVRALADLVALTEDHDFMVIDSFQTIEHGTRSARAGETVILRELISAAQRNECTIVFVVHRTKTGQIKGSSAITHAVDINIDMTLDVDSGMRSLFHVKNRFGALRELELTMSARGFDLTTATERVAQAAARATTTPNLSAVQQFALRAGTVSTSELESRFRQSRGYIQTQLRRLNPVSRTRRDGQEVWKFEAQ